MKNMRKKLAVVAAAVVMTCSVALTGCQQKLAPADQVVGAMYDLVVKDNAVPMKDLLGFASEDDVKTALMEDSDTKMADMFKDEFASYGIDFTDEELDEMSSTMQSLLNKLSYTAEITEQTKDSTTVVLKVTGYTSSALEDIMTDLMTDMQNNMDEETMMALASGDEEATKKVMQDVIKQYVVKAGEMEPSTETTEITVKCEKMKVDVSGKEKVAWMPVDMTKFSTDLDNSTFH